jgi:hypothetical protein
VLWFCQNFSFCQTCVPVGSYSRLLFSCSQTCTNLVCTTESAKTASMMFCQPKAASLPPRGTKPDRPPVIWNTAQAASKPNLRPSPLSRPSFASAKSLSMTTLFHQSRCQTCVCPVGCVLHFLAAGRQPKLRRAGVHSGLPASFAKTASMLFLTCQTCVIAPLTGPLRHKNRKDAAQAASEPKLRPRVSPT